MQRKLKKTFKKYTNIPDTFRYAFVGIPGSLIGSKEHFYGTYEVFLRQYPDLKINVKLPTVLYMHGSSGLYTGDTYRRYIVEDVGAIFFAPDSKRIHGRPSYTSPVKEKAYIKVHKLRLAEIEYAVAKLQRLPIVDRDNIFLMGNSEGGLAAAIYKSDAFKGRIITAFSCESSYFYSRFKLGSKKKEPFLNIMGTDDQFFSTKSSLNRKYKVQGNGIDALKKYRYAKIVILTKTKHDITTNPYVRDEIVSFLRLWIEKDPRRSAS